MSCEQNAGGRQQRILREQRLLTEVQHNLDYLHGFSEAIQEENIELTDENEKLKDDISELKAENENLKKEVEKIKAEMRNVQDEKDKLKVEVESLKEGSSK